MSATVKSRLTGYYVEPPIGVMYTDDNLEKLPKIPYEEESKTGFKSNMYDFSSASIWVVIPVPLHTSMEEFCYQDIGICPIEHAPLNGFGLIDSPLQ